MVEHLKECDFGEHARMASKSQPSLCWTKSNIVRVLRRPPPIQVSLLVDCLYSDKSSSAPVKSKERPRASRKD